MASNEWKSGLCHVFMTFLLPTIHVFGLPVDARFTFAFSLVLVMWLLTLLFMVMYFFRFHAYMEEFIGCLEIDVDEEG